MKGLVVIQEWWGLNDQIVEEAALISTSGFVTLTPRNFEDIFNRTKDIYPNHQDE
jgi:dienelactone hydrolase